MGLDDFDNYKAMTKEKLIEELKASRKEVHGLKNQCQKLMLRIGLLQKNRELFHGKEAA